MNHVFRTWVVIPTYNERDNLQPLIERIRALPLSDCAVLIVDDASPDGTGTIADKLARSSSAVQVIHRPKKAGLAGAYVEGFRYALARGAEFIFEMDADFSHDPNMIPTMQRLAERDADLVLGSRYVPGGRIVAWDIGRRLISRIGNRYARAILGVPVRDLTGGFKCFRRGVLERIDLTTVASTGYNFQIELTYKAIRAGFRVREVPITFTERRIGRSKFHAEIVWESTIGVWRLRQSARHGFRFRAWN